MKTLKTLLIAVSFLLVVGKANANTEILPISQINYNGGSNDLFFLTASGKWGDPACPNASYVHVKPSAAGRQELLSLGLAAYMAGKKVQFWGTCATAAAEAGIYYDATYIVVTN